MKKNFDGQFALICVAVVLAFPASFLWGQQSGTVATSETDVATHRKNAQIDLARNRPDLAIGELRAVVSADPEDTQAAANLGVLLYFRQEYGEAIPMLRRATAAHGDLWKIQALLGLSELKNAALAEGRADLAAALPHLQEVKLQTEVRLALADADAASNELEEAVAVLKPLTEMQPPNVRAVYMSHRIYADLADHYLLTLTVVDPDGAAIHQAMGRDLARQNKTEAALANYKKAVEADPEFPGLRTEYGLVLYSAPGESNQKLAEEQFEAALKTNPRDSRAELMLGVLAWRKDDADGAYAHDLRAHALAPEDADASIELAKVLLARKDAQGAEALLRGAIKADPTNAVAHFRLSQLLRQTKRSAEATQENALYQQYKKTGEKLEGVLHSMQSVISATRDAGPM